MEGLKAYSDDHTLRAVDKDLKKAVQRMQRMLNALNEWSKSMYLPFNPLKTKFVVRPPRGARR